jgi:putative glutamine amidotransferase
MRIGITQRVTKDPEHGELRDALSHDWIDFINKILPEAFIVPIPNNINISNDWFDEMKLDFIFLSNGNDLGEYPRRDKLEEKAISYAIDKLIPILGICRGFQILNRYFGGSLTLDLEKLTKENHVNIEHRIRILDQHYIEIFEKDNFKVNSYHNHGVLLDDLSLSLKAFAISEGSIVEGFFHQELPIIGIQWHPERPNNCKNENRILISSLINSAISKKRISI